MLHNIILFYQTNPIALTILAAIIGLAVGSFLNVVIYRLPVMLDKEWRLDCKLLINPKAELKPGKAFNLFVPRSKCQNCNANILSWQNIPLISYIVLLGKCRSCKTKIPLRYPLVELLSAVISGFIAYQFHYLPLPQILLMLIFSWILISLFFIDYDHKILPDSLTLGLLWIGLIANLFNYFTSLEAAVIGAMAGYLFLWAIYWLFKLLTKKEGMGYGDFKLLAALCAWLGWQYLPIIAIISALVSIIIFIILRIARKRDLSEAMPYGPSLAIAGWVCLIWGDHILLLLRGL